MKRFTQVLSGLVMITTCCQVESLMWNLKPGVGSGFRPGSSIGSNGWRDNYGQWDTSGRTDPWKSGLYGSMWNFPTGNNKGSNIRRCFSSRQCNQGQCCQIIGYSNMGVCVYGGYSAAYGCNDQSQNIGWLQRPVYPENNKGEQVTVARFGKPGGCPPSQFIQGPQQYCRTDENCPNLQKCCYIQGKAVCAHAIFA